MMAAPQRHKRSRLAASRRARTARGERGRGSEVESARDSRAERAREATRAEIARAALQLFLDEGYERVSMRRIADAVGYTPGALYAYFRDKDEILYALHVEGFARLRASIRAVDALGLAPGERMYRIGEEYLRFAFENPRLYDLMFITSRLGDRIRADKKWQVGLDNYDHLRGVVREAMEAGVLPAGDVEAANFATWAEVHGIAAAVIRGRTHSVIPDRELPRVVRDAYRFAFGGLLVKPAPRSPERPRRAAQRTRRR
jgi:AcrR family transcriptional regulator